MISDGFPKNSKQIEIPPRTTYAQLLKIAAECLGVRLDLRECCLLWNGRALPKTDQIVPRTTITPQSTLKLWSRALIGGSESEL